MGSPYFRIARFFMALLLLRNVAYNSADGKPCTLCPGGEDVTLPDRQLNLTWPVSASNCTMLDAYANSLSADSDSCANVQSITTICGCPRSSNACHLCPDGSNVTLRDKKLSFLASNFDGAIISCEQFDAYLHSINASSDKCVEAQVTGSACGCPVAAQDGCDFCRGENMTTPNKTLPQFEIGYTEWYFNPPTCELLEAILYDELRAGTAVCLNYQDFNSVCGCSSGLGQTESQRQIILAWLPRVSALLSIFGSSFIIYDIVKKERHKETLQYQLLFAMSCVDCMSSIAWLFTTIPIPETYPNGDSVNIYGARGNEATCVAQGFFIQLGLATPFCNLALAVYYMLVIIYSWREDRIKKYRLWIIGLPLFIGLVLACAGIPFYEETLPMCYVEGVYLYVFLIIPISTVIFFATAIMFMIFLKVYNQERRVQRWIVRSNGQSLPRKVFWQGVWYLMCFYVSWPMILILVNIEKGNYYSAFGFFCTAMFVAPLQGFLNFIVYTHKRIWRCMKQHNMCSCSLRAHECQSPAATTVTATSLTTTTTTTTTTSVNHQHEWNESQNKVYTAAGVETALCTVHDKKQMVDP